MNTRILLAGILGGVFMFIWTSVAHMALPLGETGVKEIPNEASVVAAMQGNIGDKSGFYLFPGPGVGENATRHEKQEAMKKAMEKLATSPSGILMYNAARPFTFARYLGIEFATELIEAILVVFLLAQTNITSFGGKVGFVLTAGILAALATNVSYWNWYGFPANYTMAYMFIQIVQFFLVGVIAGLILRPKSPASA
ncbi:MAG TPA: hypothetical protein VM717_06565 [Chthoniobacterales bacterium]|jgi:hypothetical protein|nr:hypothetical protein [Chthoniobacterales bacterium]